VLLGAALLAPRASAQAELQGQAILEIEVVGAVTVNPRQVTAWAGLAEGQ
jgi:hypothetical protein